MHEKQTFHFFFKINFYEAYDLENPIAKKWPFVLVMQTKDMLERTKDIIPNLPWVVDSTFKTN